MPSPQSALRLCCHKRRRPAHSARAQVLIRRGGVRERRFELPGPQPFLLFPTGFHNRPDLFQPGTAAPHSGGALDWEPKDAARIPIKSVAQVRCCSCVCFMSIRSLSHHLRANNRY